MSIGEELIRERIAKLEALAMEGKIN